MSKRRVVTEAELAALAKGFRLRSGKTKTEAAAELGVGRPSVQHAEEAANQSLTRLRCRMIEKYSKFKVVGPVFLLERK